MRRVTGIDILPGCQAPILRACGRAVEPRIDAGQQAFKVRLKKPAV
jgi:hypothetical protein